MFRKTFIRLIMIIAVATTTLILFAARQIADNAVDKVSCEPKKETEPGKYRSEFMILEAIGRTLHSTGTN